MDPNIDIQIRLAAFEWLSQQIKLYGDILDFSLLKSGFKFNGKNISLVSQFGQGIYKPQGFKLPLTALTSWREKYEDSREDDNFFLYKYRGTDPDHIDNKGMRQLMHLKLPFIYFYPEKKGKYMPIFPVFIQNDNPLKLTFYFQADALKNILIDRVADVQEDLIKSYVTREVRTRIHQHLFRDRVISAYHEQCALCKIRHIQLLDAAHIIPDHDERGEPIVSNGISLCKIHHAAYDSNLMGVSPDYRIHVKLDLLEEIDGPMLQHGIKELHQMPIQLPKNKIHYPSKNNLSIRFDEFLKAG